MTGVDYKEIQERPLKICYVLALNEFDNLGKFTNIDDSDGGDGVV